MSPSEILSKNPSRVLSSVTLERATPFYMPICFVKPSYEELVYNVTDNGPFQGDSHSWWEAAERVRPHVAREGIASFITWKKATKLKLKKEMILQTLDSKLRKIFQEH